MEQERDRLHKALDDLSQELNELENVQPELRERLEHTLGELKDAFAETPPTSPQAAGLMQRLTESARHFEETHPSLAGTIGSVIDALARMGI